jgi:hypothetical protein
MRKPYMVVGCCGLILIAVWAFGQQELDASRWRDVAKSDDLALAMFVRGYIQGYTDGDSAMEKVTAVITKGAPIDSETKKLLAPQATRIAEVEGMGKSRDLTVGKIKDTTSAFYSDHRNAPVCWNAALQFSLWSLNGDAATEQELNSARMRGAESGCK